MVQLGYSATSQLRLKADAAPNPAAFLLPSNSVNSPKVCQEMGCQTETPASRDVGCQTSPDRRDIGVQYCKKPERRSKSTQVIRRVKHKACSTDPAITLVQDLQQSPLAASTPVSSQASTSDLYTHLSCQKAKNRGRP